MSPRKITSGFPLIHWARTTQNYMKVLAEIGHTYVCNPCLFLDLSAGQNPNQTQSLARMGHNWTVRDAGLLREQGLGLVVVAHLEAENATQHKHLALDVGQSIARQNLPRQPIVTC